MGNANAKYETKLENCKIKAGFDRIWWKWKIVSVYVNDDGKIFSVLFRINKNNKYQ